MGAKITNPMKIAYVSGNRWPGREPGLSFSLHNARGFSEIGADFTLVLSSKTEDGAGEISREFFADGTCPKIHAIPAWRISNSRQIFYWRAYRYLARADFDLVIFRALTFLPWAARLKRKLGIPVWFEAHDFWTDPALRDEVIKKTRLRHIRLEQRFAKEADGILCVSEPQAELYRRYYPDHPVVAAPTSCQPARPTTRTEFSYTLGYVGSLNDAKYPLSIILRALAGLADQRIRLLVVGARNDDQKVELERLAEELGVGGRVEVHCWKVGAELTALEDRMDVGIACLTETFLNRIASPLKILEYLASGMPFVATRLEGIGRLVTDGVEGSLVANTPEAWGTAIEAMYSDFATWQKMSSACTEAAQRMSWAERARTITAALEAWQLSRVPVRT